jgi:hypothetical protein
VSTTTKRKINIANFNTWVEALESDDFLQVRSSLIEEVQPDEEIDADSFEMLCLLDGGTPEGYCCLGVAETVRRPNTADLGDYTFASLATIKWLGIPIHVISNSARGSTSADVEEYDIATLDRRGRVAQTASGYNDSGEPFWYIAAWLRLNRDNLWAVRT